MIFRNRKFLWCLVYHVVNHTCINCVNTESDGFIVSRKERNNEMVWVFFHAFAIKLSFRFRIKFEHIFFSIFRRNSNILSFFMFNSKITSGLVLKFVFLTQGSKLNK